MAGRPGLPGNAKESAAAATLAANSELWTLGFKFRKASWLRLIMGSNPAWAKTQEK